VNASALRTSLTHARDPAVRERWLRELSRLLAFPSVWSLPSRRADVAATAAWLAAHLGQIGMEAAQVLPGAGRGAPSVYAEWLGAPGRPTLLIYGHYDVQPPGPAAAWRTPPFGPTVRGNRVYARGASDDKGQLFMHLKALECHLATLGRLPVNVKVWLEGEEESGSPSLEALLAREAGRLRADAVVASDTEMVAPGRPTIVYGLRGSLVCELELRGPSRSLHSGRYGGAAANPLQALAAVLASLHDAAGRVAVPGFYRQVRPVAPAERAWLRRHGRDDQVLLADIGQPAIGPGEPGYSLSERATIRPALNLTGLAGGSVGPGATSSLPPRAAARLNVRLVPDQEPAEVAGLLRRHIRATLHPGVSLRLRFKGGLRPVLLPLRHPAVAAAARAVEQSFEQPPALVRSGGSIGPAEALHRRLRVPVVLLGFAGAGDNAHGPNESFSLATFYRGVETLVRLLTEYGR
jgi:acetylornithine deacetylase/succinyl-diaminopimelate desuccinylase-like protein